jgi:hypothetical protein
MSRFLTLSHRRMPNGQALVVGAGDGGVEPSKDPTYASSQVSSPTNYGAGQGFYDVKRTNTNQSMSSVGTPLSAHPSRVQGVPPPGYGQQEGFGNAALPPYGGGVGEGLHGQRAEKR